MGKGRGYTPSLWDAHKVSLYTKELHTHKKRMCASGTVGRRGTEHPAATSAQPPAHSRRTPHARNGA